MTQFTAKIVSGGLINIPKEVEEMNGLEKGDLIEIEVNRVRRVEGRTDDGEPIYGEMQSLTEMEAEQ